MSAPRPCLFWPLAARGMVKHGNRGITGKSGWGRCAGGTGCAHRPATGKTGAACCRSLASASRFAPLYHPAFAAVKEARGLLAKEGQRSNLHILGPLLESCAQPDHQLVGVFESPKLTEAFSGHILLKRGRKSALDTRRHGSTDDGRGMDELSNAGHERSGRAEGRPALEPGASSIGTATPLLQ